MSDAVQASLALADSALQSHHDITGKADKVTSATNGNFAGLDANGNLTDSGSKAADFATAAQSHRSATSHTTTTTATTPSRRLMPRSQTALASTWCSCRITK